MPKAFWLFSCAALLAVADPAAAQLTVVDLDPIPNAVAAVNTTVSITFDRAVARPTVNTSSFRVFGRATGTAAGGFTYSAGDTVVTFTPTKPFSAGETVFVNLANTLEGADSSSLRSAGYAFQFGAAVEPSLRAFSLVDVVSNRTSPGAQTRIYGAAASDFNNDDYIDLATVNEVSADIRVMLNTANGSGTFHPFLAPEPIGVEASPNESADFDNDGNVDLAVSATVGGGVWIMLGNGDGTFATPQAVTTGTDPHGVTALDVDGDADWDIVGANVGSDDLALLINDGNGVFSAPTFFDGGVFGEYGLTSGDMDNDGIVDLLVGGRNGEQANVMLGNGDGCSGYIARPPRIR